MTKRNDRLVSVVIPTHDRLGFLQEAVRSVRTQSGVSYEAVVVDDASSDGTSEWLAAREDEQLRWVRLEEGAERSGARNRGLENARGSFVLFLDDDDRLRAGALGSLHRALARSPYTIGAIGAHVLFNDTGQRRRVAHPRRSFERTVWLDILAGWTSPPGAILWKTDVIRTLGGWNEDITGSEDRELLLRAARRGPVVVIPQAVLDKRTHGGQWRSVQVRERQARWTNAFVDALPPNDRPRGSAARDAYRSWNEGRRAYGNLRPREAVDLYVRAVRTSPMILTSPLLRRRVCVGFGKSLAGVMIGPRGVVSARRVKRAIMDAVGRNVEEAKRPASQGEQLGNTWGSAGRGMPPDGETGASAGSS